jgi:nitroreductase
MNPVLTNIYDRRSVRFFDPKPVPRGILQQIIDAGNAAPSGMNTQGWRFVAVEEEQSRRKFAGLTLLRYQRWLESASESVKAKRAEVDRLMTDPVYYGAPVILFLIGNGLTKEFDCPLVMENMMLAARSLGIGSCWVHFGQMVLEDPAGVEALDLKLGEKAFGPVVFGYPKDGQFPPAPPKRPAVVKWA